MPRIKKELMVAIRSEYVVRLRSLGKSRKDIEQLSMYLDLALLNLNDLEL